MSRVVRRGPARSITWPIFALVIGSVIAATAILFVVTLSAPPPIEPPRSLDMIARILETGARPRDHGGELEIGRSTTPPAPHDGDGWRIVRSLAARRGGTAPIEPRPGLNPARSVRGPSSSSRSPETFRNIPSHRRHARVTGHAIGRSITSGR